MLKSDVMNQKNLVEKIYLFEVDHKYGLKIELSIALTVIVLVAIASLFFRINTSVIFLIAFFKFLWLLPAYILIHRMRKEFEKISVEVSNKGILQWGTFFAWNDFYDARQISFLGMKMIRLYHNKVKWKSFTIHLNLKDISGFKYALEEIVPEDISFKNKLIQCLEKVDSKVPIIKEQYTTAIDEITLKKKKRKYLAFFVIYFLVLLIAEPILKRYEKDIEGNWYYQKLLLKAVNANLLDGEEKVLGIRWPRGSKVFHKIRERNKITSIMISEEAKLFGILFPKDTTFFVYQNELSFVGMDKKFEYDNFILPANTYIQFKEGKISEMLLSEKMLFNGQNIGKGCSLKIKNERILSYHCDEK